MKRQKFIQTCGAACVGSSLMMAWLQSCAPSKAIVATYNNNQLIVPLGSFFTEKNGEKKWTRVTIVRHEKVDYPIAVYRLKENEYRALLLSCTHQQVELNVYGDLITCSAHGSEFSNTGEVLKGPAEKKLQTFPVTADNQNVYIRIA